MASAPYEDDEATVKVPSGSAGPAPLPLPVDVESARLPKPPLSAAPAVFVAQGNDVDPEATNIKPFTPAEAAVEATSVERPPRSAKRRFSGEPKVPGGTRPRLFFFSIVAILTISALIAVFLLVT